MGATLVPTRGGTDKHTWYIHATERSPALKMKDVLAQDTAWMNPEAITVSERIQTQRDEYCMLPLIGGPSSCQIQRDRKWDGGCQGLGELLSHGDGVSVLHDEQVLGVDGREGCTM